MFPKIKKVTANRNINKTIKPNNTNANVCIQIDAVLTRYYNMNEMQCYFLSEY